jgi:carbamoyl-phosphate synthase large subunit
MNNKKLHIRVLITGAGSGASGNLIRALRNLSPRPYVVGLNDDPFALKLSLAERNYLSPEPASGKFVNSILEVVKQERINIIMPTDDQVVKVLSDERDRFSIELLLPRRETIDLCQDKYALNVFLRRRGISAPETYLVRSLRDLDRIFARLSPASLLWCRARHGSRSLAAIPVASVEQARTWITQWRDLQGMKVSDFTLGEYLPGRHFIVHSVWHNGSLLRAQSIEVLGYFGAGNNPSGVFSLSCLAKTVVAVEALQLTLGAVQAIEQHPSGAFSVELRESGGGEPAITEINAGRFPAGVTSLLAVGNDNMVAVFASAVLGQPITAADPHGSALQYYLVRDIDAVPGVFSAGDILKGISRIDTGRRSNEVT